MAQEKIIIKFEAKGHQPLIAALDKLTEAQKRATGGGGAVARQSGILDTQFKRNAKSLNGLGMAFSVMRSKMLLFAFGAKLVIDPLARMGKEAAKVESMGRAFDTLSGGVGKSRLAFSRLQHATNNTMTEMDLLKQANNAMILGVTKSSEEMAEMFDIAQRLGRALGQDTASSVESLITGIGRQSRLMLDNIGIIVKAEEAYDAYAEKLGVSTDSLTDAQKKQAFFNATMDSARSKVSQLGDEQLSAEDTFQKLATSSAELRKEFGRLLLPLLQSMADKLSSMNIEITRFLRLIGGNIPDPDPLLTFRDNLPDDIKSVQNLIAELESQLPKAAKPISNTTDEIINQQKQVLSLKEFYKSMGVTATGTGLKASQEFRNLIKPLDETQKRFRLIAETDIIAMELAARSLGVEIENLPDLGGLEFNMLTADLVNNQGSIVSDLANRYKLAYEEQKKLMDSTGGAGQSFQMLSLNMDGNVDLASDLAESYARGTKFFVDASNDLSGAIKEQLSPEMNNLSENTVTLDHDTILLIQKIALLKEHLLALANSTNNTNTAFQDFWEENQEGAELLVSSFSNMTSALQSNLDARMKSELDALKATDKYKRADAEQQKKMEKDKMAEFKNERLRLWKFEKASNLSEAGINIATAITKALPNVFLASLVGAMGAVQIAAIASAKPPKFAQGGLIGGRRHSQGGTMIEAEQGEFVMSRNAVESIGIENLNRMNQGGGGAVTVNVSGNVLSQDFVEGELAENIKEAVRRGTDFGIS